jgi:phosphate:Na+ symporter
MGLGGILGLAGGLALFLYGMNLMGSALEKRAGRRLKLILSRLASNPFKGMLLGAAVTGIIQSSAATTVMVVGFVNSGIMTLEQSVGIVIGANVGTSITGWLLSLTGVQGGAWYLDLIKPSTFTPVIALAGIVMLMFIKKERFKDTAGILLGFAVLMFGMQTMSSSVAPLGENETFRSLLTMFSNPVLGVLAGTVVTALIQSSSASVGILQALSATGAVSCASALPIIFGFNIGTCVTSLMSSSGTSPDARRAAVIHLTFNILSALVLLPVYYLLDSLIGFGFASSPVNTFAIALINTVIKVLSAFMLLPFSQQLVKLSHLIVKDTKAPAEKRMLDERLFINPSLALDAASSVAKGMADTVSESFSRAISLLDHYSSRGYENVREDEQKADKLEDMLGTYLVKLGETHLGGDDSHALTKLLRLIGDLERISDHALAIAESARELNEKELTMSAAAQAELNVIIQAVGECLRLAINAFTNDDVLCAAQVEPLEQVIDDLCDEIKSRHIERVTAGLCPYRQGYVYNDILTNLERIADHCSNLAIAVIERRQNAYDAHDYAVRVKNDDTFRAAYAEFKKRYTL